MPYHSGNQLVDPLLLFEKVQLQPGMHIADFGCGRTGHVIFPATKVLGETGLIYAVDILKEVLEVIHKRAASSAIHTIQTVWSDIEEVGATAIVPNSLDIIFLVNTLSHVDNRHGVLEEAKRLLKDKARLVIVDWKTKGLQFSPDDERFVDFDNIAQWCTLHGLVVQEEFAVGPHHHGMILYKHD